MHMLDRNSFELERAKIFSSLFELQWKNKKIWEHIRDGYLTATPAFEGELYQKTNTKIMFVGRDLNGWDEPLGDCSTLKETIKSIVEQTGAFDTIVAKRDGPPKYNFKKTNFFRFIKHILEFLGESDSGIDETWNCDSKRWNQRFVWANLYCISPRNPASMKDAHPENAMVKLGINDYVDLMELYIHYYQPDVVVFITDVYRWFVRWSRLKSFKDFVENYNEDRLGDTIVATGNVGRTRILVCKRPDRRGTSHQRVEDMAEAVAKYIMDNG